MPRCLFLNALCLVFYDVFGILMVLCSQGKEKEWEFEETSWFFLFITGGRRKAMIALSISYKMEMKALGLRSKDCQSFEYL